MKKAKQLPQEEFDKLPLIPKTEYKLLWHDDYWDGPVQGMLEYKGEKLYFMMHKDGEYKKGTDSFTLRTFTVYKLKPDILARQMDWHKLFQRLVGTHTDYENETSGKFSAQTHPNWESFFERKKKEYDPIEPDLDDPTVAELVARIEL